MTCEETRLILADDPDEPPAAARAHLVTCAECRELAEDVREGLATARAAVRAIEGGPAPALDMTALVARTARPARPRLLRRVRSAAALLLAAVGVLALFQTRIEAADGAFRVRFALPGTNETPAGETPEQSAVNELRVALDAENPESALRRSMERSVLPLAEWMDEREDRLDALLASLERRAAARDLAVHDELRRLRTELDASRDLVAAGNSHPALPEPVE